MKQLEHANDAGQSVSADARLAVLDAGTAAQRELASLARQVIQLGVDAGREAYTDPDAVTELVALADPARTRSEVANELMNIAIGELTGIDPYAPIPDTDIAHQEPGHEEASDSTADANRATRAVGADDSAARDATRADDRAAGRVARRSGFAAAVRGVDAIESLFSAVSAAKARLVAEAHAHAHEDLVDSSRVPGEVTMHADGTIDRVVSRNQITAAALGAVLQMAPGAAGALVRESVRLVRHMPRTLAAIASGEVTTYGQHLVCEATKALTPDQAQRFDELLTATPLADPVLDLATGEVDTSPGAHRASTRVVRRRIATVTHRMDLESANQRTRREGLEGRCVRFGRPGHDGMTDVYASLPTVFTTALRTLLTDLAATRRDGDERTTDQLHADVLMTLFSGPAALAPAAQLTLGFEEPVWDDDAHVTVVDEPQTLQTRCLWDTIRALAAFLDLTFPDTPRAMLHIDVTLETLTAALGALAPPGDAAPPNGAAPPGSAPPGGGEGTSESTATGATDTSSRAGPAHTDVADVDLATACADSGRRHRAATVRGLGDIDSDLLARLARFADLQRIITDPITGQPIEVSTRRPSKRLRDAVINRDRTCRFPNCERPASTSDLDHITPWRNENAAAGGAGAAVTTDSDQRAYDGAAGTVAAQRKPPAQTSPMNLACLCREHHRDKHQLHWQPTMLADGSIRWRNPLLGITTRT